jgi:diguanylate cyclase (GGDEF)-like protein
MEYFENHRNAFCTTRLDKEYVDHKPLIDEVFGVNTINTWMFAPIYEDEQMQGLFIVCTAMCSDWNHRIKRNAFVDSDVGIMLLMFRQLMDAIERMENRERIEKINNELHIANERLQNLAVRDMLTGLYNRQGFAEELESLIHMVEVEKKRAEMSILYSDLDNFKPYNDEFGHDIGDLVLTEYAKLLKEVCEPDGYVVRYGGDEFLVIIPSVDREVVEGAAKKIFEILREERGFTDKVSKKLGRTVDIPEEKYLSCSIGISCVVLNPEDSARDKISDNIKRADEMMYYIKKTVKHRYVFYEDVQDKMDK